MSAAETKLDRQLEDGIVKNVMPKDIGSMMQSGWTLLDVRPYTESNKVHVKDAIEVPIFVPDTSFSLSSLLKQLSAFGMGGWWLGGTHMIPNESFLSEVQDKIPKDAKVMVGCQKGVRSLAACEQMSRAGYKHLAWVSGGFDNSTPGQVPTVDDKDVRLGGIGGFSEMVGWTEVQQEQAGPGGSFKTILVLFGIVLVLDISLLVYEQWYSMSTGAPLFQ